VRQVLQNILEAPKYQFDFRVEQPDQLADSILAKLPDTQREIDLTHVQVFLGELWDRAVAAEPRAAQPVLHRTLVKPDDNLERVLDSFLKKQLEELALKHGEKAPLELLAAMISERQTKLQMSAADLKQHMAHNHITLQKPLPDLLRDLEEHRILRALKSGEVTQYEITHDVLARVVGDNLTEEMKMRRRALEISNVYKDRQGHFTQDDLNYLRPYAAFLPEPTLQQMAASEIELARRAKAEKERNRSRLLLLSGLLVAALVGLGFAWWQFQNAESARVDVQTALDNLEAETAEKDKQRLLAEQSEKEAKAQTQIAQQQTNEAEKQRKEAEARRIEAQDALQAKRREEEEKNKLKIEEVLGAADKLFRAKQYKNAQEKYEQALLLSPSPERRTEIQNRIKQCKQ